MSPSQRRSRALGALQSDYEADALLVTSAVNVRYLTGFTGEGYALVGAAGTVISTDGRYRLTVEQECPDCQALLHDGGHLAGIVQQVPRWGCTALAFEPGALTYANYSRLSQSLKQVALVPAEGLIERLRVHKDPDEIAHIVRAAGIVDGVLPGFLSRLEPGRTERELALELEREILLAGAERIAFDTIVAAGPSAAYPHATPGRRVLEKGMMLKVDVGCCVEGYCSDITRTVYIGTPDARFKEVHRTVREAQAAGFEAAIPGAVCSDVDRAARAVIEAAGFSEYFVHGLGHGVGMEVHELPLVSARSDAILEPGMVITIEPGVYIEGWGGVRIEDLLVVSEDGARKLTTTPIPEYT